MSLVLKGYSGTADEVEAATRARRVTIRPIDYGSLGSYSHGSVSGSSGTNAFTAGLAANSIVWGFRWGNTAGKIGLIRRVQISAGNTATAFTAGVVGFNLFVSRSFTGSFSAGGTDVTPVSNDNKRRTTGMGTSLVTQIYIATTAAISGGTQGSVDAQPIGSVVSSVPNVAGTPLLPPTDIWSWNAGDSKYPLYFVQDEGLLLKATVPATGTWFLGVTVEWDELVSTNYF